MENKTRITGGFAVLTRIRHIVLAACLGVPVVLLSATGSPIFAQAGPGSAVAEFLNVDPGARAGSMAGAFSAVSGDLTAFHYNPSSLAKLPRPAVVLHHSNWYQSTYHEYAGCGFPVGSQTVLAASFGYVHYGSVAGYDAENNPTGDFSPSDAVVTVAAGRQFGDFVSLGLAGKYFQENLGVGSYSGWALDAGVLYRRGPFSAGLAVLNFGPEITAGGASYPLPVRYRVGIGYSINNRLLTSTDVQFSGDGAGAIHQGAEYSLMPNLFVRAGYRHQGEIEGSDTENNWTVGGGLIVSGAHFDYNFMPGGVLGDIHRFTVSFGK